MRRPCIECNQPALEGQSRCGAHSKAKETAKNRRRSGPGKGAGLAYRMRINRAGGAVCAMCGIFYLAENVKVDHVIELADGGEDTGWNLQVLCNAHHNEKTVRLAQRRTARGDDLP